METKKEFKYFTIFNHEKEENYLREMNKQGWKFVRVGGLGMYRFERSEAENVVYQLDYDPRSKEDRDEYLKMFSDCGWEYIQEYAGYSYFRKPAAQMNGEEHIFNDEESKSAMMERVFKGRLIPLLVIFCAVLIPQFIMNIIMKNYMIAAFFSGILLLYIALFIAFAIGYNKNKRK